MRMRKSVAGTLAGAAALMALLPAAASAAPSHQAKPADDCGMSFWNQTFTNCSGHDQRITYYVYDPDSKKNVAMNTCSHPGVTRLYHIPPQMATTVHIWAQHC